ncbi:MAG: thioredoxin family protein, partial [Pseudomonadota bacterium]
AGAQIGWGFQLQNPIVVGGLAYLLFIIGLNLMGYFEFGQGMGNVGNKLTQGNGLGSSFFTGILATLVATPCTAPFMAGAIGFALTQPAIVNLAVFAALGLGLALPYLALSFAPALQKVMPKPGAWMNTFKQALAFPMFAGAIWLVWVISKQAGPTGVLQILTGMGVIGFGIWLWGVTKSKAAKAFTLLLFAISAFMLVMPTAQMVDSAAVSEEAKEFGEVFTPETLNTLLAESDDPVFVEMTAAWCITCKVNHATSINIPSTKKAFAENNVQYLIGDWTNQDPEITKFLNSFGRNGVPIYVYYAARNAQTGQRPEAQVLPQILTPGSLSNLF